MNRDEVLKILRKENPGARAGVGRMVRLQSLPTLQPETRIDPWSNRALLPTIFGAKSLFVQRWRT